MTTELGKIHKVHYGYYDGRFGLFLTLGSGASRVQDSSLAQWNPNSEITKHHKYTAEDVDAFSAKVTRTVARYLTEAKVDSINSLVGTPIEITYDNHMLKSWRILVEVL